MRWYRVEASFVSDLIELERLGVDRKENLLRRNLRPFVAGGLGVKPRQPKTVIWFIISSAHDRVFTSVTGLRQCLLELILAAEVSEATSKVNSSTSEAVADRSSRRSSRKSAVVPAVRPGFFFLRFDRVLLLSTWT